MNIGIIVHSKTGTTLKFSEIIAGKCREKGHTVDLVQLKTDIAVDSGSVRQKMNFSLINNPDCSGYDAILAGGPVWALSASPIIIAFLEEQQSFSGKKLLPFVTMSFPFTFMGGKQAIKLMSSTAAGKGAVVLPGKIVPKLFHNYRALMEKAAEEIANIL